MQKIITIVIGLCSFFGISQEKETLKDSTMIAEYNYRNRFFTIGALYDATESLFGIQIGNGNDEQPIIHFEDLSADILYKISAQTDFENDYSIGSEISWDYPFKAKLSILSLNFNQTRITEIDYFHRNIGLSTRYYLRFTPNLHILAKFGHQQVNEQNNVGFGLGLQNEHRNIYYGIRVDYFKEYFNYSAFLQSFVLKDKINVRLIYDRIDKYDFLNIGINYLIIKTTANNGYNSLWQ